MITPDDERSMNTFLGISESLSKDQLYLPAIDAADWIYIEGYLVSSTKGRAAALKLYREARARNVQIALSLSDPAMVEFFAEGLQEMIGEGLDLLFCNREEALKFTQSQTLDEAAKALKGYAKSFAITYGGEGALVFDGDNTQHPGT